VRGLGVALFATFAAAKATALVVVPPPASTAWLTLWADDAAVALVFAIFAAHVPRAAAVLGYAVLSAYAAINVATVHTVGTPLLLPMLRGVDLALRDSAAASLAPRTLAACALVVAVAVAAPFLAHRRCARTARALTVAGALLATLVGLPHQAPAAHRNAVVAMLRSTWPRSWRQPSPAQATPPSPAPASVPDSRAGQARGRSVIVVLLESAAARFLRPYGAALDPMPFLTQLATRSILCTRAGANYPESIKGQLALWHGVAPAPDTSTDQHARVPVPGLPALLAKHGYRSGLFHAGRFRFLGMAALVDAAGFEVRADAATIGGERESSFGVDEESTVTALLRFVDALPPEQPFVAAYLPIAGHHPYSSPPGGPFANDHQLGCYRNALHYADRALRALWEGLCQRRSPRSLVLCIVGDHGQAFGEHDGNFGHTFALYEENLHVPLLLCVPGCTDSGARCDMVASHVDVVPTLLDLLGLPAHPGHEGQSLLRAQVRPAFAFTDWGEQLVAVREGDWKLILDVGTGAAQLFDLASDPWERADVGALHPARAAQARRAALDWIGAKHAQVNAW
jgi:arylsulfatase A-like enzyme